MVNFDVNMKFFRKEKDNLNQRKYAMITLRVTDEEKNILENHSFMTGLSISDIIRESLKVHMDNERIFETTKERKEREWIL